MMSVIQIRPAQREGARIIIGLAGVSGSGKTYTALQLAYGMTGGDGRKVGLLDTENKRGSLYADEKTFEAVKESLGMQSAPGTFQVGDLYPPFSPDRYIASIQQFQADGVEVLVIDSATHEYEGTGGCIEIAEAGNPKLPNWNKAKAAHKKFMNAVLQCDMHIIFCVRAREKSKPEHQVIDGKRKLVYADLGLQAIQEKNFMFEMTASVMVHDQGKLQDVLKCPEMLQGIIGRGRGYITAADGAAIRRWIDGAKQLDPEVERHRNALQSVTEQGMYALKSAWEQTPNHVRVALGKQYLDTLKASAEAFDKTRSSESQTDNTKDAIKNAMSGSISPVSQPVLDSAPDAGAEEPPAQEEDWAAYQQMGAAATRKDQESQPKRAPIKQPVETAPPTTYTPHILPSQSEGEDVF